MTRRALLRASDADREQIAERLRQAALEGRLRSDELEDRLGAAFSARTYGELDPLVADLPAPPAVRRTGSGRPVHRSPAVPVAIALVVALMVLSALASALGGHPHPGPGHRSYGAALPLIWLVFIIFAVRFFVRRGRVR